MATPQMQRSVPEVLQDIIANFEQIIRSEFRLAKTEVREQAAKAAGPGINVGLGILLGFYGFGFLLLAAIYGLATVVANWLAALIVGAVMAIAGAALLLAGMAKLKRLDPAPDKTMRSMEENVQWAKDQMK